MIESADSENIVEDRYSLEAPARNDQNFYSAKVLEHILRARFQKASEQPGLLGTDVRLISILRGTRLFQKIWTRLH